MSAGAKGPGGTDGEHASDKLTGDPAIVATALPTGTLVPRRQVAEMLDTSQSSVRRLEKKGILRATGVGAGGATLYGMEQVRQVERTVIRSRHAPTLDDRYNSEAAAAAFQLFSHTSPVDVVVRLRLHPAAVEAMYRKWVALQGGYVVTHELARQISEIRGRPITDADGLLESLKDTPKLGLTHCCDCKSELHGAGICRTCAREMREQEAELAAAAAAAQKARDARLREAQKVLRAHDDTVDSKRKRRSPPARP